MFTKPKQWWWAGNRCVSLSLCMWLCRGLILTQSLFCCNALGQWVSFLWHKTVGNYFDNCCHFFQSNRKELVKKCGTWQELKEELVNEVSFLAEHLFRADHQHSSFRQLERIVLSTTNTIGMVMDFAENYTIINQVAFFFVLVMDVIK